MKKWYYNRKFVFLVMALSISFLSIVIYANFNYIMSNILDILKYLFGVLGILTTLYNYYHKFHLFIVRIKIILFNDDSKWNVAGIFDGEFDEEIQKKIISKIEEFDKNAGIQVINNCNFQMYTNGLTLYFDYNDYYDSEDDETKGHLVLRVRDYETSYNNAINAFDKKIIPILSLIDKELRPTESKFSFNIEFGKNNPFMSVAVKNIDKADLNDFSFSYKKNNGFSNRIVRVYKKGIECTTNSLTDFQSAASNFLLLVGE
ncbi:hypothetical protein AYJ08_00615 [Brevibacillus sp. SKDU10]|uniref:hypothetical protein n=1 Tax=Brevibacillus sp. SKDU10 TaxID=1247872 RepID=UPI0007C965D8|nr:hypothetical protein [Brevibacillus sp. SKDU10]OAJ74160.1 hypothetical protein AYJ08_00615 [Brevibacillus sp. SKDU10]